jgi:drug/metabolite transporter (DMT)-like permease
MDPNRQQQWPIWVYLFGLLLAQILFSGYHVIGKIALSGKAIEPLMFTLLREFIATPTLFVILLISNYWETKKWRIEIPPRNVMIRLVGLGVTGICGNQILFLYGLTLTTPENSAALQPLIPVFATVGAIILREEKINWRSWLDRIKILAILCAAAGGVEMVLLGPKESNENAPGKPVEDLLLGNICLIGNCICFAIYVLLQRPLLNPPTTESKAYSPLEITCWAYLYGTFFVLIASCTKWTNPNDWIEIGDGLKRGLIWPILYAAFLSSAGALLLITWANRRVKGVVATLFQAAQPFTTSLLSWIVLKSILTLEQIAGALMIVVGLGVVCYIKYIQEKNKTNDSLLHDADTENI